MVSGSGVWAKMVVVDARHRMLGRLASIIAKELLNGQKVVVVGCEEICMSGGLVRQKTKSLRFLRKHMNTKPEVQSFQESNLSKFKSEVQSSQEQHFSTLQRETEKLRGDIQRETEKLRGDIQRETEKLRGDIQCETEKLLGDMEKMCSELRYEIRNSGAAFREHLEAAKYDVIECCTYALLSICAVGIGTALAIH